VTANYSIPYFQFVHHAILLLGAGTAFKFPVMTTAKTTMICPSPIHQDNKLFPLLNAARLPNSLQRNLITRPAPDKLTTTHTHKRQTCQVVLLSFLAWGAVSIEPRYQSD
jgi:hypothetical protein